MSDVSITVSDSTSLDVTVSGSTSVDVSVSAASSISVTEKGPKGDTGATGPQGPAGADGADGVDGANGGTDIVLDTTPQLGGNLDTNNNNINFGDADEAVFGAGSDLKIYHAGGSINHIFGVVGASTYITGGTDLYLRGVNGEEAVTINGNGSVELFHDNVKKLETTSDGIELTGTITSPSNGDIVIDPNGTGAIILKSDDIQFDG